MCSVTIVDILEVEVTGVVPSITAIKVSTTQLEVGVAVVGSNTTEEIVLTNPGTELVQWKGQVEPSFFSLPLSAGLLKPAQSVTLAVVFKPAAPGVHTASLTLHNTAVGGGHQTTAQCGAPVVVTMRGTAMSINDAVSSIPSPTVGQAKAQTKKTGTISLESDIVMFPDTKLGETTVSKVLCFVSHIVSFIFSGEDKEPKWI